ncbi:MAG: hypothetical protein R3313_02345 [Candidatus Saccharimonadales bacterium]|nr:hypothetical protein [Candidatus Saccharimonadales bacterium]
MADPGTEPIPESAAEGPRGDSFFDMEQPIGTLEVPRYGEYEHLSPIEILPDPENRDESLYMPKLGLSPEGKLLIADGATPNIVKVAQYEKSIVDGVINDAELIKGLLRAGEIELLKGLLPNRQLFFFFWQASTRTRMSFVKGGRILGMDIDGESNAVQASSVSKHESLRDTVLTLHDQEPEIFIFRHPVGGAAELLAKYSGNIPIINGGDGQNEHPTQTIVDTNIVAKAFGRVGGLHYLELGDAKSRVTRSEVLYVSANYDDVEITILTPKDLSLDKEIVQQAKQNGAKVNVLDDPSLLVDAIKEADVVSATRAQAGYWDLQHELGVIDDEKHAAIVKAIAEETPKFQITWELAELLRGRGIIKHPMPIDDRVREITPDVMHHPNSVYRYQAADGKILRASLLHLLLTGQTVESRLSSAA